MRKGIAILVGMTVATAASAQLNPSLQNLAFSQSIQRASQYPITGLVLGTLGDTTNPSRICLRETATRKQVCRSYTQWRAIAARIDAGQPWRR